MLRLAARRARLLLALGLLGGFLLPGAAAAMKPWLPWMVAFLVFVSALRVEPRAALGGPRDAAAALGAVLATQLALPLAALAALRLLGWQASPYAIAAVLAFSAPSISGAPAFTALLGHAPDRALRLLVVGTAILPLTVLPVFWLSPALGGAGEVALAAGRLAAVLVLAIGAAFALRRALLPAPGPEGIEALDGLAAVTLSVIVVGLMSAVGPALRTDPASLLPWLALAFAANYGMQAAARALGAGAGAAVVAGNRNVALFLVAFPAEAIEPLLLFIGCYQVPMYLTPCF